MVSFGDRTFSLSYDVSNFSPNELNVYLIGDFIVVEGKHTVEGEGDGEEQHFHHEFLIPEDVSLESIRSTLDSKGNLVVIAQIKN
ncbi:hypothetical protein QR680_016432 [Steinernema hermaphroditum]|uniref:SHSP domain-containing protein n=1 Tax=Steinernema hermaphroditum TaxID=289476 RepID=A0AA39LMC1_9BILA|nr:hypothetical protein QR680_016432 [Steinernema hermaphroditum]